MRRVRRLLAFVFVGALLAALPVAAAGAADAPNTSAFESIGGCFAAQKRVLLTFVMDESASLGDASAGKPGNDPTAQRVTAAQVAVDGIANLASQGTKVDVLLTGFSEDLNVYGGWQALDPSTRDGIKQQLDGFRTRNTGQDTDFYNAMAGVQKELAKKSSSLSEATPPCELILLFTDGRFDIDSHVAKPYAGADEPKDAKAAKGTAALCAATGPMQRLRDDGGRLITLALGDADRAFLQRLATGDCNTPGNQYGASFDAGSAAQLVGQFDAIATRLRGGSQVSGNCAQTEALDIAPALRGFHVFADAGSPPAALVVTPPGRPPVRIDPTKPGSPSISGLTVRSNTTGNRFVVLEASPAPTTNVGSAPWTGRWTMQFDRPSTGAQCQLFVFEAWKAALRPVTLQRGVPATLTFDLVDENGKPVPPTALTRNTSVTASFAESATAKPIPVTVKAVGNSYQATLKLPADFEAQTAIVNAVLHVKLAGTDVASAPTATEVSIQTPLGFPKVTPTNLRLSSIEGKGTSRAMLTIVGDSQFKGRVCVAQVDYPVAPPVAPARLVSTKKGTCVDVAPGQKKQLTFAVNVRDQAYGRVTGRLHLELTGANGRTDTSIVPFTFSMTRPIDTLTRNRYFFVLFLVGLLAPLALLWFISYLSAAFELPPGVRAARLRVRVFPDGRLRRLEENGEAPPFALDERDFAEAGVPAGRVHSFDWIDLSFDARWHWNPFAAPHGEVAVKDQYVTASEGVLRGRRRVTKGRVPLTLPGVWVFALDPPSEQPEAVVGIDGTVSVFIAAGAPFVAQAPRVMESLTDFFAQLAERINVESDAHEPVHH